MLKFNIEYALMALLAIALIVILLYPLMTQDVITVTIINKECVDKTYFVFTEHETFQCSDVLVLGKFNSSDVYGSLQEGETYIIRTCGFRIPVLSEYRNIIRVIDWGL